MADYVPYTPSTLIDSAMFNFDVYGIADFRLDGTIRVSASDAFSHSDWLGAEYSSFYSGLYTSRSEETPWTATMSTNMQDILRIFSQFANITFEWLGKFDTSPPGADSTPNPGDVGRAGLSDINISWIYRSDGDFAGISGINSDDSFGYIGGAGDIFLNEYAAKFAGDYDLGLNTRARQTLMHEIGHSLGLAHPHSAWNNGAPTITADYAATRALGFAQLGFRTLTAADMYKEYYSIMSYDDQQSLLPSGELFHAHTPMILDVIALQQAYGEGSGTSGSGNDTITAGTAGYRTYFDTGGIDTIDLSLYADGAYLRMGERILDAGHLVGVAMSAQDARTTITQGGSPAHLRWYYGEYENADGGPGNDVLYGNALNNRIRGMAGNDSIHGGAGIDTAAWQSSASANAITRAGASITVSGPDGTDSVDGVERLQFADGLIRLGVPVVDFDGQGRTDIVIRHDNGTIEYRLMNGTTLAAYRDDPVPNSWQVISIDSDFNDDGRADVVLRNTDGSVQYRLMSGLDLIGVRDEPIPNYWKIVGADSDFNGDRKSDLVLRHDDGTLEYRIMNGMSMTAYKDDPIPTYWSVISTDSDFNGDGKSDVVLRHDNGIIEYRLMDGVNLAGFKDDPIPTYWGIVSTDSDLNGDGKSDVILRHDNGTLEYRLMDGVNMLGFKDDPIPTYWNVVSTDSDFNGDGKSDVVLRHDNGTLEYRLMDGVNMLGFKDDPIPTYWSVVSTDNDFNGDGKSDVVLHHDNGTIEYRLMDGVNIVGNEEDPIPNYWHVLTDADWQVG